MEESSSCGIFFFELLKEMISDSIDDSPSDGMQPVSLGALFWVSLFDNG